MPISPILPSPIQQRIDAPGQPASAPISLTMDTFQAARDGVFGPEFLLSGERQPVLVARLPPLLDSHLGSALQVLGQPDREEAVQAIFQMLTGQPKPRGFESDVSELMNQTQATQSMPDASKATIDVDALMDFVERNPGQALSRPEILVMLIFCLILGAENSEQGEAFRKEMALRHINSMGDYGGARGDFWNIGFNYEPLAELTAADVDEVFTELTMSPRTLLWNEIEEMSVDVPEADVDGVLKSLDVQPERSLSGRFPLLAELLSNVPGTSAEVVNEVKPESGQLTDIG